jgi:predicted secreted acid phosphatase
MNKIYQALVLLLGVFIILNAKATPTNLDVYKQVIIHYYNSGQYFSELAKVSQQAEQYLLYRVYKNHHSNKPQQLAIVFDIDETALSNYQNLYQLDFGGDPALWDNFLRKANAPALSATLKLFRLAQKNNVTIFFITGR